MENAVRREAQEKEQSSAGSSIAVMLPGPRSVEIETNLIVRAHES